MLKTKRAAGRLGGAREPTGVDIHTTGGEWRIVLTGAMHFFARLNV